jgi:hypothetical protein
VESRLKGYKYFEIETILQCPKTTPMLFKGNFPFCTNLKNFNSLSFFPTSESLSRTSWKTSTTEASLSNGFPHLFGATFLLKMTETSPQIYKMFPL